MDLFTAINTRRSVREYLPDPVSEEDLMAVLGAANMAPSAMNRQQWEFVVVTGGKIREMGQSFAAVIERFARGRAVTSERGLLDDSHYRALLDFSRNYGGAPVVIVVLTGKAETPDFYRANIESASAAMENLLLAATARGLGTCWTTGPLNDDAGLRRILEIPDSKELVAVTPLGHPARIPPAPPRHDPDLKAKVRRVTG